MHSFRYAGSILYSVILLTAVVSPRGALYTTLLTSRVKSLSPRPIRRVTTANKSALLLPRRGCFKFQRRFATPRSITWHSAHVCFSSELTFPDATPANLGRAVQRRRTPSHPGRRERSYHANKETGPPVSETLKSLEAVIFCVLTEIR